MWCSVKNCAKCGFSLDDSDADCPKCQKQHNDVTVNAGNLLCPNCNTVVISTESNFCLRCGFPVQPILKTVPQKSDAPLLIVIIILLVGGWLLYRSTGGHANNDATLNIVSRCDSGAMRQLYFPNTMELVSTPESYRDNVGGFIIKRVIAARDNSGVQYRYLYTCFAQPDGKGGIGEVSVVLLPTNE